MERISLLSSKIIFVLVFFLLFSGTVLIIFKNDKNYIIQSDFYTHYPAAVLFKEGKGKDIYNLEKVGEYSNRFLENEVTLFTRAFPFVVLFYFPFTFFPLEVSYKLFGLFWISIIAILSTFFYRYLNKGYEYGFLLLLPLLSFQLARSVIIGQSSVLLFIVSLFVFFFLDKKRYFLAGFASAFFLAKLQYITVIPFLFLLSKKRLVFFKGLLVSSFLILAVSVYITGIEGLLSYPSFLLGTESYAFGSKFRNMFSLASFLLDNFPNSIDLTQALLLNAVSYLILLFLFFKNFKKISLKLAFAVSFVFGVVSSAHVYNYDLVLLIIPTIVLIKLFLSSDRKRSKVLSLLYFSTLFVLINYTESIFTRSYQAAIVLLLVSLIALFSPKLDKLPFKFQF